MIRLALLSAVVLTPILLLAQGTTSHSYRTNHVTEPGELEAVIMRGARSRLRHELGWLTPPGTAGFFAVVASDPSSQRLVKGIEVQLEGDDPFNNNRHCKDTIYIDEEGLEYFQQRLEHLVQTEQEFAAHIPEYNIARLETPTTESAANRGPSEGVYDVALSVGFYRHSDGFGLYIYAPESDPPKRHPTITQFLMPNADIPELLKIVRDGREWLKRNTLVSTSPN